ncbi:MAG TPA: glycosyltransferase family 2 protein [Thermoanaerobaculia bacterium]
MIDVSVIVVSHNDERDLPVSVGSAVAQRGVSVETLVVDNSSTDRSRSVVADMAPAARLMALSENVGFAGAMNRGIRETTGRYVLALNPDCRLSSDFAAILAARLDARAEFGSASGRILRGSGEQLTATPVLDSAGIFRTATGRHFDRGSSHFANGRYLVEEPVFGTSGAAGFYRRAALESAKISTGYFDSDFFLYREDADLAWRLQNLGWKCLYVPDAVGYHRRRNLPERRSAMPPLVNMHSVKNRFLLRINNQTPAECIVTLIPTLARDAVVVGACLTIERSSLPAFSWLWKNRQRLWAKRREIQRKVKERRREISAERGRLPVKDAEAGRE